MNNFAGTVAVAADLAAILTSIVAVIGYGRYEYDKCLRRSKLEQYLKLQKSDGELIGKGQRSILHLMAKLGMSESQVYEASFKSKKISRAMKANDETRLVSDILFEWIGS